VGEFDAVVGVPASEEKFLVRVHNAVGVLISATRATNEEEALLAPDLATVATVVVGRRPDIQDLAPEGLRDAVSVHGWCIGREDARDKRYAGSSFLVTRWD